MNKNDPIFKKLLSESDEFRKLYEAHLKYEKQLELLDKTHYLSPEQDIQRKTIQKLKLNGKDQMLLMLNTAQVK